MRVKKSMGRVYGASMTAAEKKAMNMEIQRQLAEYDRKNTNEIDAIVLWNLHVIFGFGPKRLKKFYDAFGKQLEELCQKYEIDSTDEVWLCTKQLKNYGIDLEEWSKKE